MQIEISNTYDHIVIGGGSAGCLVAARLTDDGARRVLLIEAGSSDFNQPAMIDPNASAFCRGTDADWQYRTIPQAHADGRVFDLTSGKVLGGSSTINSLVWVWGQPSDFDAWAEATNADWNFESLKPIFQRLETSTPSTRGGTRGDKGPMKLAAIAEDEPVTSAFYDACRGMGLEVLPDVNGPVRRGAGPRDYNIKARRRFSVAAAILAPVLDRANLTVLPLAIVESLLLRGTRCVGVRCHVDGECRDVHSAHNIILSAGTIGSPAILLRSGIGPAEPLRRLGLDVVIDLPGVGENLHDHCLINAFSSELKDGYMHGGRLGAHLFTSSDAHNPNVEIEVFLSGSAGALQLPIGRGFSLFAGLLQPQSRGTLSLTSAEPGAPLRIDPNYLSDPADMKTLSEAVRLCTHLASSPALLPWRGRQTRSAPLSEQELASFIRSRMATYFHPVGTCAMGAGKRSAVDPILMVHGIDNLRVADSSVMPRITTGNTLAPTLVIAERAASLILAMEP